jgi:preprotein translocase subunit SecA
MALDDDVVKNGLGPDKAERLTAAGRRGGGYDSYGPLLTRAQRKIERKHLRDRFVLLYHEKERKKLQREMGQDPYLDTPD